MMSPSLLFMLIFPRKQALGRLSAIVFGVALGTAMIVLLAGAFSGLNIRDERSSWVKPAGTAVQSADIAAGQSALLSEVQDRFEGQAISRIDVFAPPGIASTLPAVAVWPRQGQYYASKAMADLINSRPRDMLGDRYGEFLGLIGDEFLKGPDALVAVVGQPLERMLPRAGLIDAQTASGRTDTDIAGFQIVIAIGAIGMLFPVLLFVSISTRLGAAARQEMFSTLRLVGASPKQLGIIAATEMMLLGLMGTALGLFLAALVRPLAARFSLGGSTFYPADLDIGLPTSLLIAAAIILSSTVVSIFEMWRSRIGPLGSSRSIAEKTVTWRRIVPLILGLTLIANLGPDRLGGLVPESVGQLLLLAGFALAALGIVVIGPWLTSVAGRMVSHYTESASGLIVANRIAQAPVATFRAVSGLIIAVFMVTIFVSASSGVTSRFALSDTPDRLPLDALLVTVVPDSPVPTTLAGATRIITGYGTADNSSDRYVVFAADDLDALGVSPQLQQSAYYGVDLVRLVAASDTSELQVTPVTPDMDELAPRVLIARADQMPGAMERARTALQQATLWTIAPLNRAEGNLLGINRILGELSFLAYVGAAITIIVAGLSLAVSSVGTIMDRKRAFGLLRLTGAPAEFLRLIVFLEALIPLAGATALAIASGYLAGYLIMSSISDTITIGNPNVFYILFIAAGVIISASITKISSTFLTSSMEKDVMRFE